MAINVKKVLDDMEKILNQEWDKMLKGETNEKR